MACLPSILSLRRVHEQKGNSMARRIVIDVSSAAEQRLDQLKEKTGLKDNGDLFRHAVAVYDTAVNAPEGTVLGLRSKDGEFTEIQLTPGP